MACIERWAAAAVAMGALAAGLPAAAQSSGNPRGNPQGQRHAGFDGPRRASAGQSPPAKRSADERD